MDKLLVFGLIGYKRCRLNKNSECIVDFWPRQKMILQMTKTEITTEDITVQIIESKIPE